MFDKTRERIQKLEETNETFRKVSTHLQENKQTYLAVGVAVPTAFVAGKYFQRPIEVTVDFKPIINNTPIFNNTIAPVMKNIIKNTVNNGGHCTKVVKRLSDDQLFEKAKDAALDLAQRNGVSYETARTVLSKHLNGHIPDAYGEIFRIVAVSTTGSTD